MTWLIYKLEPIHLSSAATNRAQASMIQIMRVEANHQYVSVCLMMQYLHTHTLNSLDTISTVICTFPFTYQYDNCLC